MDNDIAECQALDIARGISQKMKRFKPSVYL